MAITRVWQSGFEFGVDAEFDAVNGGSVDAATVYTGNYAFKCPASAANKWGEMYLPSTNQFRTGFYIIPQTGVLGGSYDAEHFAVYDVSANSLVELQADGDTDTMQLVIAGTVQTESAEIDYNTWQHWGVDVKLDASAGWVKVYKNGVLWLSFEGNTGAAAATKLRWGTTGTNHYYSAVVWVDDIYVDDTTGEAAAAAPPTYRYILQTVTADGNYAGNWTGSDADKTDNYAMVDDIPADGSATYLIAGSALTESFVGGSVTLPGSTDVNAYIPTAYALRTSGTAQFKLFSRYSSTDLPGTAEELSTAFAFYFDYQGTVPGGGAWTEAIVEASEIGIIHA